MRLCSLIALAACLLLVAGCGEDEEATPTETGTITTPVESATVKVYLLRDGTVWPVARKTEDALFDSLAVGELLEGPTESESADLRLTTELPEGSDVDGVNVSVKDGVATVELEGSDDLSRAALAQLVYTVTAHSLVDTVRVGGQTYTRADFEDQTPAILVESPLAFEEVSSPLRVTGTANTFEATFQYELTDTDGKIVDDGFVTATTGTGTRGTFDFTTGEFAVPFDGIGALIVYELSAKDGKTRLHLVEIPLEMSK